MDTSVLFYNRIFTARLYCYIGRILLNSIVHKVRQYTSLCYVYVYIAKLKGICKGCLLALNSIVRPVLTYLNILLSIENCTYIHFQKGNYLISTNRL